MNLHTQWVTLMWMLCSGAVLGVAFDSYRVVSGQLRFPRWSIHMLDLLYWIVASLFVFRMLYMSNQGQLRFYVFLGLFIGVWVYYLYLSVLTERIVVMLMMVTKRVFNFFIRLFQILIVAPLMLVFKAVKLTFGFLWIMLLYLLRIFLLPLWRLVAWMFRPLVIRFQISEKVRALQLRIQHIWSSLMQLLKPRPKEPED
ncbi:spore cortex biosynthesis protein YabQ [Paenibacillus shirakamiensis]|uniref:Spore cortex biosynthesis protein YabQ n=1 Tax=Paenibacillus shirakamiensis TaxID=1265935 RepID=A0ABS4JLY5_9BACL|nr:spore cortex biosynthesis protein YabQ [Paenibacillus shirakamiensis]MBP2002714.1 spore cortex biosynthesis protein YabQ [Paenibacillus shirakamiensis]